MRFLLSLVTTYFIIISSLYSQQTLLKEDFDRYHNGSDGSPRWHPAEGIWQIIDGKYYQQSTTYDCASLLDFYLNESFELETTFEHLEGDVGVGFVFSSYQYNSIEFAQMVRFDGGTTFLMGYFQNGEFTGTASTKAELVQPKTQHTLRLQVDRDRDRYSIFLDGKIIQLNVPLVYRAGYCGLQSSAGKVVFHHVKLIRLPMKSEPIDLNWIKQFMVTSDHHFLVPNEREGVVQLLNAKGEEMRTLGKSVSTGGQLHNPNAVALLDDSTLVVTDRGSNRIHLFSIDGRWKTSTGWKGTEAGSFDEPVAVSANEHRQIFVLEKNAHRIQAFNDSLHVIAEFGREKLIEPLDLAVKDSLVYVVNTGLSQIECFVWDGKKATWKNFISYGGGQGRGIAVHNDTIYLTLVNEVRAYNTSGRLLHRFYGRSIDFILPWGIVRNKDRIYIADFMGGRIVVTTPSLLDPTPRVTFTDSTIAAVEWSSSNNDATVLIVTQGKDTSAHVTNPLRSNHHRVALHNLKPSTVYHTQYSPTVGTIPPRKTLSREYPLITPAGRKTKQYVRLPMAALIFANVYDDNSETLTDVPQPSLADSEIVRIKNQLNDAVKFYWIHSGMNLHLDLDFIIIPERLKRSNVYGEEWWYPPRDSVLENYLRLNGKNIADYTGILFLTCTQMYDTLLKKYVLAGKGGAFTNGVGTGKGYGISWWDVTKANHNAGNNWLMVHEFNHQLDDIFLASGYPEYWFNHISPTIGTAAAFGEHFDANRYILRMVPWEEWFDLKYTQLQVTRDADEDGIPDNEPKLPLDELRLNSDSTETDTDGDGISDFNELTFSNWLIEGWGETYGGSAIVPNLNNADTDDDKLTDDKDLYPCYPTQPQIKYGTPTMDGTIASGEWHRLGHLSDARIKATIYTAWNDSTLNLAFEMDRSVPVKIMIDADADGWFTGRDNYLINLAPEHDSLVESRIQIFNASDPNKWPFMDQTLAERIHTTSAMKSKGERYLLEIAIPRNESLGLSLVHNEPLGILIGFLCPFDQDGSKRYVNLFEPNRFFYVSLQK
ncbi:MAG: NHL repeat-containing protein [Ignavibacteriae bacterium]|nr:NHL repeat-containing protein [Ignavibacteriota bacterium]